MATHSAKHLIIGGGIIGCSIAYHLARRGEKEVVLLERAGLTEGATWHAAGLVGQLRSSRNTTRMLQRSVAMYDRLQAETGVDFDWKKTGSLRLAASKDRMLETRRLASMARSFDLEMQIISAQQAQDLFPYIETAGLEGAAYIPSDGHVDPAALCQAIAKAARQLGADLRLGVEVLDFTVTNGRITRVETSAGSYEAESITLASGMWSRELGAKLGLRIPACALEHQYIITEPIKDFPSGLPTLRDPDHLVYYKPDAGGRLIVGGYEANTKTFGNPVIPSAFVRQLLPDDLDRFAPLAEMAAKVTPVLNEVGIRQVINGPIPYSADGDFVMGPVPGLKNLMLASGFLYGIAAAGGAGEMIAEWLVEGRPSLDLWPLDNRRFDRHQGARAFLYPRAVEHYAHHYKLRYPGQEASSARNLRLSPLHDQLRAQGAVMGSKNGWERPLWFAPSGVKPMDQLGFISPGWQKYSAVEHHLIRTAVGLIDQSSFAKFELIGAGALACLQSLAVSNMDKPIGQVIYTQLCNARGGIEADLTITRLEAQRFYIVTGAGFGVRDSDWIRQHLPKDGSALLVDVTSAFAVINICGPQARAVLQAVSEGDLSPKALPFGRAKDIIIGAAPVRAIRIGYVGELGYELHIPTEFCRHVYDLLWQAGQKFGIGNVGYRAIDSLRMEKSYLYWSADITPDYSPIEAGLGGRVHFKSGGDFTGRAALEAQESTEGRRLCCFTSPNNLPLYGGEPVLLDGQPISLVTSAAFGHTVDKMILFAYLEAAHRHKTAFTVEAFGESHAVQLAVAPLYDPTSIRLKS